MGTLSLALYCEGSTDEQFIPPVAMETARRVLAKHKCSDIEVLSIRLIRVKKKSRPEAILQAAREAYGYHALLIHSDADSPTPDKAKRERYDPGHSAVQSTNEAVCKNLLPIIPVQAIEAWMLADYELLLVEIGTSLDIHELGIPEKASQVEAIAKPKQRLKEVVQRAYASRSKRQRDTDIDFLYEAMGEKINLDRLLCQSRCSGRRNGLCLCPEVRCLCRCLGWESGVADVI
jgi:Domain of unknown function (DUF4276)